MTERNVGVAVDPPQMGLGSSSTTIATTYGSPAGAYPANEAT